MSRGGAHFTDDELNEVLSRYDIGKIQRLESLTAGNRRAPKMVVFSERGKFLLKRRGSGRDDFYRVAFAHAVHIHLARRDFPVSKLVITKKDGSTIVQLDHHIYEMFTFIEGTRYDGSSPAARDAGRKMAGFHGSLEDFKFETMVPLRASFHDSGGVRSHLKTIASEKKAPIEAMKYTADALMRLYESASVKVNALGFDTWPEIIVHGDWHPGNMLFAEHKVVAMLDFDSVKIAPAVTDLANGMLQFSIVGGRPDPADWPDYLDMEKLSQFLNGYIEVSPLQQGMLKALPDLMIETMIAEAILPVATTGFFGHSKGEDFLKMISRKAKWINDNRRELNEKISPD
ncbi:MAG: phosphotransferase [Phycisphaerae bacterium]